MPPPYILRPATASDQATIKALIRQNRLNPLGIHWQRFLLAIAADGTIIGCGQIKPHRDGSRELASIAVVASQRRQGVAAAIIQQLHADNPGPLWLTCASPLIPFYIQFGYAEVTDLAAMPPYFRRVRRLVDLFSRFTTTKEYLGVMVRSQIDNHL